jgi:hypothetical protein
MFTGSAVFGNIIDQPSHEKYPSPARNVIYLELVGLDPTRLDIDNDARRKTCQLRRTKLSLPASGRH